MKARISSWAAACLMALTGAHASAAPVVRLGSEQATRALHSFEAQLDSHDSATAVLQAWCDRHVPSPAPRITAHPAQGIAASMPPEARRALGLGPGVTVRYRRVALSCGDQVLSRADNWYLPSRLTADMNRALAATQIPFGAAVKALDFRRRPLSRRELAPNAAHAVLRNAAVLVTPDGTPFSYVVETYTDRVLAGG